MSAENTIHPKDRFMLERLHDQHCEQIHRLCDEAIKLQDATYELGRLRGKQEATPQWVPVGEQMPEAGKKVIAYYSNPLSKARRIMGCYYGPRQREGYIEDCSDYDDATDTYWWPAGWYECIENWDDFSHLIVSEGEITHWQPLPAEPEVQP